MLGAEFILGILTGVILFFASSLSFVLLMFITSKDEEEVKSKERVWHYKDKYGNDKYIVSDEKPVIPEDKEINPLIKDDREFVK